MDGGGASGNAATINLLPTAALGVGSLSDQIKDSFFLSLLSDIFGSAVILTGQPFFQLVAVTAPSPPPPSPPPEQPPCIPPSLPPPSPPSPLPPPVLPDQPRLPPLPPVMPPSSVHSPIVTVLRAGTVASVSLSGAGMQSGDLAKWVRANATDCSSNFDAIQASPTRVAAADAGAKVIFSVVVPYTAIGLLALCYKFNYQGRAASTSYVLFPAIRAAVVSFERVSPRATAVGCISNLTIDGAGFDAIAALVDGLSLQSNLSLPQLGPTAAHLMCGFGALGSMPAAVLSDTRIVCRTIAPTAVGTLPLRIDISGYTAALSAAFPSFHAYNASLHQLRRISPAGGVYHLAREVGLHGDGFADFGSPRCRFDLNSEGDDNIAAFVNASFVTCRKPSFPDSFRHSSGPTVVTFSANGQCYPVSSTRAGFYLYNSQIRHLRIKGAPAHSTHILDIIGEGFVVPALQGSVCRFSHVGQWLAQDTFQSVVSTPLTSISATHVQCPSPAAGQNAVWRVQVLQNGADPVPSTLGVQLTFQEYTLKALKLHALVPPGAPAGLATTVTIHGDGFALYGDGQLVCRLWAASDGLPRPRDVGILGAAMLLDSTRVICSLPSSASLAGARSETYLSISLNNGTAVSLVDRWLPFRHYLPPRISSVTPAVGNDDGGTLVVLHGSGFAALSQDHALRVAYLRVRLGSAGVPMPVTTLSDTRLTFDVPWGAEGASIVQVALDSVSFAGGENASAPTLTFRGSHAPSLLTAYFDASGATTLVIRFDSQPTNRAGMLGVGPCSAVLDASTSAQIRGTAATEADCYWSDESTLIAQLTMHSHAGPGMRVRIRSGVLWPKAWTYPGRCDLPRSKCASGADSIMVDSDFPCDVPDTPARELCVRPVANIVAPREISSCSSAALTLDGTLSVGGGARALTYRWTAPPASCDNHAAISEALSQLTSSTSVVTLKEAHLFGGSSFEFQLVVTDFLGVVSAPFGLTVRRAAGPIPSVSIYAPPLISLPSSTVMRISSLATFAPYVLSHKR